MTGASIQNGSITATNLASGQVVKTLNGLTDAVSITNGTNVTLATNGNTLTIAVPTGGQGPAGPQGPPGVPGTNGINGTNGLNGAANAWRVTGNAETSTNSNFLVTSDPQPLEIARQRRARTLRLELASRRRNVIGGFNMQFCQVPESSVGLSSVAAALSRWATS